MREKTCCFTGPRPKELIWGYEEKRIFFRIFRRKFKKLIENIILAGYTHFISGMALGIDMLAAELVLELKEFYPFIILECAIPCKNQFAKWSDATILQYHNIISEADKITYVSNEEYFNGCMALRNMYMIEQSSLLIAVYDGNKVSGTFQTIRMAKNKNLQIKILKP